MASFFGVTGIGAQEIATPLPRPRNRAGRLCPDRRGIANLDTTERPMSWDLFLLTFGVGLLYGAVLGILALYLLAMARRARIDAAPAAPVVFDADNVTRLHRVDRRC